MNKELWLSPMEGVSDLGFRSLCIDQGADMTFTEMIRADAIARGNKATLSLIDTHLPIKQGIQLLVSKPAVLQKALEKIDFTNITRVDLNFGCPSPDVIGKGKGPALLKRVQRMKDLLSTLKEYSPVPCGIKIRLGMNSREKKNKIYLRVVELANEAKLDWITVHPKTADQSSRDPIDMDALQEVCNLATIPVIGNGFVCDQASAQKMFDIGCSAVMVARAAVGNPWVFKEMKGQRVTKDYTKAFEEYEKIAKEYGTKEKFFQYHKKIFELRKKGDMGYHSPSRVHLY